jgi:hypothetical protein
MAEDGGPAFPVKTPAEMLSSPGMSLRDYFAAQALVKLLTLESFAQGESSIRIDAARCYRFADAMLAERKK